MGQRGSVVRRPVRRNMLAA